jgi:hypothetical protein
MNFEPLDTTFAESFSLTQQKHSSGKIITHVIQVRRHWVDPTSEIDVMGEVEVLYFGKGSGSIELEKETALVTVLVSNLLDDFLDL